MKWYFASRTRHQQALIAVADFLKSQGETVCAEWLYHDIPLPYSDHLEEVQPYATAVVSQIQQCDIFVLISDPAGTDMFVELGIALGAQKKIYIVGEHARRSLMQVHPDIMYTDTVQEVFTKEGIDCAGFIVPTF